MAWVLRALDLIGGAGSRSNGSGPSRLQRRRGLPGNSSPRRRVGKNLTGAPESGVPGQNRSELGSGMLLTPCVIHWIQKKEAVWARSRDLDGDGGSAAIRFAGASVCTKLGLGSSRNGVRELLRACSKPKQGTGVAGLDCSDLAAVRSRRGWWRNAGVQRSGASCASRATGTGTKEGGDWGVAHRGSKRTEASCRSRGDEARRRLTDGARGPARCSGLPSLGSSPINTPRCYEGGTGSGRDCRSPASRN